MTEIKKALTLFLTILILGCSTESKNDYVDIVIPEGLTDKKAIALLQEDEENLNRVFNSLEDGLKNLVKVAEVLEGIKTKSDLLEKRVELAKAISLLNWTMSKAAYNGFYFVVNEELEKGRITEIMEALSKEEAIVFTKELGHIKLKEEELSEMLDKYTTELESINMELEAVTKSVKKTD